MTHKVKDCVERPRKTGAKWTGKNIQPDEYISKVDLAWDAKRDRWNGYVKPLKTQNNFLGSKYVQ